MEEFSTSLNSKCFQSRMEALRFIPLLFFSTTEDLSLFFRRLFYNPECFHKIQAIKLVQNSVISLQTSQTLRNIISIDANFIISSEQFPVQIRKQDGANICPGNQFPRC